MNLILASKSPRRQELLRMLGFDFKVLTEEIAEDKILKEFLAENNHQSHDQKLSMLVEKLAMEKANAVWQNICKTKSINSSDSGQDLYNYSTNIRDTVVLAADTIVAFDDQILGKPKNELEAIEMLELLSGNPHQVYTGVALKSNKSVKIFYEQAEVTFHPLDDFQKQYIRKYVASGDPLDKAGAYGIQGTGSVLVQDIKGDFYTVMGLPISRVYRELLLLAY